MILKLDPVTCVFLMMTAEVLGYSDCPSYCNKTCNLVQIEECARHQGYCCGSNDSPRCCSDYFEELKDLETLREFSREFTNISREFTDLTDTQICGFILKGACEAAENSTDIRSGGAVHGGSLLTDPLLCLGVVGLICFLST